jgi:C-terminal processing protease CtpA/Prc
VGIKPDIEVKWENQKGDEKPENDPQLMKAIEQI